MPKEIFGPAEYDKYRKYLTGDLKLIRVIEASHSHTSILYFVPPTINEDYMVCDKCGEKAEFLFYEKDHLAQTTVRLWCSEDTVPIYKDWLKNAK